MSHLGWGAENQESDPSIYDASLYTVGTVDSCPLLTPGIMGDGHDGVDMEPRDRSDEFGWGTVAVGSRECC